MDNKKARQMIVSFCKYDAEWDSQKSRFGEIAFGCRLYPLDVRYQQYKLGTISLTSDQIRGKS